MQGSLSVERMCELARVSRAGFYRSLQENAPGEEDVEVRSVSQRIALEHRRRYGYRRVTAELRRREMLVNHKRVWRMMREDNLLAVQPKAFVTTTDSNHALEIYLNLARRMTLTGIVADITYIRLRSEFVYLVVILDGFSRKVVGWKLDPHAGGTDRDGGTGAGDYGSSSGLRPSCITPIAACSTRQRNTLRS